LGCTGRPSSRAAREDVDRELVVVPAVGDVRRGRGDRLGDVRIEHPQVRVDLRGRALDPSQGPDVGGFDAAPRDGEVLHRALSLRPPQGVGRDPDLAHRVALDAVAALVSRHQSIVPRRGASCS
jgi:hypothetical protein